MSDDILLSADAAKLLGITPAAVRNAADVGLIHAFDRTPGGVRLFRQADVEWYRKVREARLAGRVRKATKGR